MGRGFSGDRSGPTAVESEPSHDLMHMFSIDQLQLLPPSKCEDLENLVNDLMRAEWRDFHAQRHGRQGQAQQGVDVFGRPSFMPGWAGVQCKNKDLLIRSRLTLD